jgi:hypothetical protein
MFCSDEPDFRRGVLQHSVYWTKRLRRAMGGAVWVDCGAFELLNLGSILI